MKRAALFVAVAVIAAVIALLTRGHDTRSAGPVKTNLPASSTAFDRSQSAALFVGIRSFSDDESVESVPYAVDDAVDLAYVFALDPRVALVRPERVALALSDENPRKEVTRRRLAELKRRGATVTPATQSQILKVLNRQTAMAGADGIVVVSFATHGFSEDGAQYLLASNSLFTEVDTAIPAARVFDVVAGATRSLVLIDACRERVRRRRSAEPEPLAAAPLIQRMAQTAGQVVLYGAAAGRWAYDDDIRQNGVFTGAVLDALQCRAGRDRSGIVTVSELTDAVERHVLTWIRLNRDASIRNATQASIDGAARAMPLAACSRQSPPDPPAAPLESTSVALPKAAATRTPLRPLLEECRADGKMLETLYETRRPDEFVSSYLRWRDGCVAVLRSLDESLAHTRTAPGPNETVRFLSVANFWCATRCPDALSTGNCALFRETSRAERCFWDLGNAMNQLGDTLVRNPFAVIDREKP